MSIGQKLSELRKSKHLSQEEVADKLGVTRQTISKWETDQSTPDFDKIIPICELFGLSADELLGKNTNDEEQRKEKDNFSFNKETENAKNIKKHKKAIGISLGIFCYFLSIIWIMIAIPVMMMNPIVAAAIFLLICGIGTLIIVYSCMFYSKDKKERKENLDPNKKIAKQINEIIAMVVLIFYLIISFATFAWHITWIIWIVYGLIEQIVNLIFELRGINDEK